MFSVPSDIFSHVSQPVVICHGGVISFVNSAAQKLLGESCTGKNAREVFSAEVCESQTSSFMVGSSVAGKNCILHVSRSEGTTVIFLLPTQDEPLVINEAFICALRNQIMSINLSAEVLRDKAEKCGDEATLDALAAMTRSCYGVSRILNNASIVQGMMEDGIAFHPYCISISDALKRFISVMRDLWPNVSFNSNIADGIDLAADPLLLRILLANLLSNCLIHGRGLTTVGVGLMDSGGSVVISVSDDGCGIAPEELYTVFDRYRHGYDVTEMNRGVGLGLTVVRGIAERHGGTLILESRPNVGTTVRVSFKRESGVSLLKVPSEDYLNSRDTLLTGFADCLPTKMFREEYMD